VKKSYQKTKKKQTNINIPNILCLCSETFSVCLYIRGIYQIFGDNPPPPKTTQPVSKQKKIESLLPHYPTAGGFYPPFTLPSWVEKILLFVLVTSYVWSVYYDGNNIIILYWWFTSTRLIFFSLTINFILYEFLLSKFLNLLHDHIFGFSDFLKLFIFTVTCSGNTNFFSNGY